MKIALHLSVLCALLASVFPLTSKAATPAMYFNDTFTAGSTVNSATPAAPTLNSTAYSIVSAKSWNPTPSLTANDLRFGIASSTSGSIEVQALFTNSPVALVAAGDYVQMIVTFTNNTGLLTANMQMGFGLYNSGQVMPVAGGMNGTMVNSATDHAVGGVQNWVGYVGQVYYTGSNHRIMTRAAQTGTDNRNQDLVTSGSGSQSYGNPGATTVGSTTASTLTMTAGSVYTVAFTILWNDATSLLITNTVYAGPDTNGTVLAQYGGVATNTTYLTAGFDGLAIGWRTQAATTGGTIIDISSITVYGQASPPPQPCITAEPTSVTVATGGACAFWVQAGCAPNLTYQWKRNGTNLVDGGNVSGATSSMLVISPAGPADVLSGANGYYVTVTGPGNLSTNSVTCSLALSTARNLVWAGTGTDWDVNTSQDWLDGSNPAYFTFGDQVTFNDVGGGGTVNLTGAFLSASSLSVNQTAVAYILAGTGSFAGPGNLIYTGGGQLTIRNANSYSGGTLISNVTALLRLENLSGLGTGPLTLAQGQLTLVNSGGASLGINGPVNVTGDFTVEYDANSSYGAVFLGNLSGTAGKTLTFTRGTSPTSSRVRFYGATTVYDSNLNLSDPTVQVAFYTSGNQTYNGVISGPGNLIQRAGGLIILNGPNTFSGGTDPTTGTIALGCDSVGAPGAITSGPIGTGPLLLDPEASSTSGAIQAWAGARTIANALQYSSATNNHTLIVSGTNALKLTGDWTLQGNDGTGPTNRTIQVNNTALTTISGVVSDGGLGCGLTKTGTNVLVLNNTETYTGPTTVSAGTLQVDGSLAAGSAVTVATNGTLGGTGTIGGDVTVNQGGAIAPGDSIGTLTVHGRLVINGDLKIEVDRAGSPTSDKVNVTGTISNAGTGTVRVSNRGAALQVGDTFTLFNKAVTGGGTMKVIGGGVGWNNQLAANGTIVVASLGGPNISSTFATPTLTLNWPTGYLGWLLQSNSVSVASTNWSTVPNSGNANSFAATIDLTKTNGVYFRLIQP